MPPALVRSRTAREKKIHYPFNCGGAYSQEWKSAYTQGDACVYAKCCVYTPRAHFVSAAFWPCVYALAIGVSTTSSCPRLAYAFGTQFCVCVYACLPLRVQRGRGCVYTQGDACVYAKCCVYTPRAHFVSAAFWPCVYALAIGVSTTSSCPRLAYAFGTQFCVCVYACLPLRVQRGRGCVYTQGDACVYAKCCVYTPRAHFVSAAFWPCVYALAIGVSTTSSCPRLAYAFGTQFCVCVYACLPLRVQRGRGCVYTQGDACVYAKCCVYTPRAHFVSAAFWPCVYALAIGVSTTSSCPRLAYAFGTQFCVCVYACLPLRVQRGRGCVYTQGDACVYTRCVYTQGDALCIHEALCVYTTGAHICACGGLV